MVTINNESEKCFFCKNKDSLTSVHMKCVQRIIEFNSGVTVSPEIAPLAQEYFDDYFGDDSSIELSNVFILVEYIAIGTVLIVENHVGRRFAVKWTYPSFTADLFKGLGLIYSEGQYGAGFELYLSNMDFWLTQFEELGQ